MEEEEEDNDDCVRKQQTTTAGRYQIKLKPNRCNIIYDDDCVYPHGPVVELVVVRLRRYQRFSE